MRRSMSRGGGWGSSPSEVFAQADLQLAGQLGGFFELHFQVNLNLGRWSMLSRARSRVDFITNNNGEEAARFTGLFCLRYISTTAWLAVCGVLTYTYLGVLYRL